MLGNIVNREMKSRLRDSSGFGSINLVVYIAISAIIAVAIGALIYTLMMSGKAVGDERAQTQSVQGSMQEISRVIDESATIFRATETELGIGRNTPSEASSGGIDCTIDQFWVADDGEGGFELRQWQDVVTGACVDTPTWTSTAGITGQSVVMVADLMPYTLVDDTGLASAECTATASESERSGEGYCVPLFRYLDSVGAEFTPSDPVTKNSISVVRIVLSAGFEGNPVPVSRSKDVSPDNYVPNNSIGEVIEPSCPATLNRSLSGTNVTLSWAPVPDATQYRVLRTYNGTTTTRATLSVASMPDSANPSYVDSISGLNATSVVYQVVPTVDGEQASGCPQAIVSIQVTAPNVSVDIIDSTSASWRGARSNDNVSPWPSIEATWPAVAGAGSYEAEMREMNPGSHTPLTGWAPFDYDGSAGSNVVNGTSVSTDEWNGYRLFSRAFQVRVRAVADSGSSQWMYCYMESGDGNGGTCGTFPANSFPDTGRDGYLVMPAPGFIEVDDVDRSNNIDLSWGVSSAWSNARYNRENNDFYRIQRDTRIGTDTSVSYANSDYSTIYNKTTSTSGTSSVSNGDWADFRALRCNYRNPYSTSGSTEQCGPSSRLWSALGLPSVPGLNISVDSGANTNTVRWGKNSATTWADFTQQRIQHYDVAEQQGGGSGTSQGSGNTSSADDTVDGTAKSSPWRNNTTATSATHDRREGDFTRYSPRACNISVKDGANVAGVTAEAGQGTGVESCSDWRGDSNRYWQNIATPAISVSDTWRSMTVRFNGTNGGIYISPLNTVTSREVGRYNVTEGAGIWWRNGTSYTWNDDGYSGNSAQGTVRPQTSQRGYVRIETSQAGNAQNSSNLTINYPPVPDRPSVNASFVSINPNTGVPYVRYSWTRDNSPVNTGYFVRSVNGGGWTSGGNGNYAAQSTWWSTNSVSARAAHTYRLYSWGYYSSNYDSVYLSPAPLTGTSTGCPSAQYNYGTQSYSYLISTQYWSGNGCNITVTAGAAYSAQVYDYYLDALTYECAAYASVPPIDRPLYCRNGADANFYSEVQSRADSSSYTKTGQVIGTVRFSFGSSTLGSYGSGYTWISGGSVNMPIGYEPASPGAGGFTAYYGTCSVSVSCAVP